MGDDSYFRYSFSEDNSEEESRISFSSRSKSRRRCPTSGSRNAVLARQNRQRKKQYLENLEQELISLRSLNRSLNREIDIKDRENREMKVELDYLRGIQANSSEIKKLLRSINKGLAKPEHPPSISGSDILLSENVPDNLNTNDLFGFDLPSRSDTPSNGLFDISPQVGICLNISGAKVSLEYCSDCNLNHGVAGD